MAHAASSTAAPSPDLERFRLRKFMEVLEKEGELEVHEERVDLGDLAKHLDSNPKAVVFRNPGGDKMELIGNVVGSRRRMALGFGVSERELVLEVSQRMKHPIAPCEISTGKAPVHEVVLTGEQADFTSLPVHLQHADDGGPYISATIDVSQSLDRSKRNVGCRRLMLRGRKEAGIDLIAPSDLRAMYAAYVEHRQRMPIAFVIGSHPVDSVGAVCSSHDDDEMALLGALRGSAVPLVRCATIDNLVPADAELVLEGYLDEQGWREGEGPFGEFLGYYGMLKTNPVFHLTAITMRRDALFQTATIGGRFVGRTDTALLTAIRTETTAWASLETAVRNPVAVYCPPSCGGMFNLRVSIRQRYPGEARNALAAVIGSSADVKNVFVVDEDINIYSDEHMEWALATRFQPDRDLMVASGFRTVPLDPSLDGLRVGAKAGFDLTIPFGQTQAKQWQVPTPPSFGPSQNQTVREALAVGPKTFRELMEATGSRDGREVLVALDAVRAEGALERLPDARYGLKISQP